MVASTVDGIDLFKIAGRSISGWIPSLKTGTASHVRQPFCSQLEERLLLWLEYNPQVVSYARGDIGTPFAATYRLPTPKNAPFAIGYAFEGKPHDYLPDVVGTLRSGKLFIAEAGMEDDKRGDRNLAKAEAARRLAHLQRGVFWIGTEKTLTRARHYNLVFLHARRQSFPAFADITLAVQEVWPWGEVASVEEVESRLAQRWPAPLVEAAVWKIVADSAAAGHLLVDLEHLMFIKELTDQGRLHYGYPLGLCLVTAGRGNTIPLKEILDQPDVMWLQFRRRLDKLEPFCRIAGHTSEEVREILAALETVYRDPFPQLNLRQWGGSIYTWLTQPILDPTSSGRVTMDYLMKLVTTALEWSYQAGETDVRAETLAAAAELLILRRDTLRIIDGAGPSVEAPPSESTAEARVSGMETERVSSPAEHPEDRTSAITEHTDMVDQASSAQNEPATSREARRDQKRPAEPTKCTFSGVVPIEAKRFLDSGVLLVECPGCARTRSLSLRKGVLRFPAHSKRKARTPMTSKRWAMEKTIWEVVAGERK